MSKRKSRAKSMFLDKNDMVFLDDSDSEIALKIQSKPNSDDSNKKDDNSSVRISSRAKKQKNIYDPSDNNGPVHKKKKEALEQAQVLAESKKKVLTPTKQSVPKPAAVTVLNKTPSKSPAKALLQVVKSTSTVIANSEPDAKKKLFVDSKTAKAESPALQSAVSLPKEAPKRVQIRKKPAENKPIKQLVEEQDVASTSGNSDFEKASTIEMDDKKIPDVSKWSSLDVYNYFVSQGFDKKEVLMLKEQEIDGEALLILNRDDLKGLQIKVGTFVKMWNRILTIQSGKNEFFAGWK